MGSLSPIHWLIVIVVILLLFGPSRLAGVGKGLGEGIRSFKKGLGAEDNDDKKDEEAKKLAEKSGDGAKDEKKVS